MDLPYESRLVTALPNHHQDREKAELLGTVKQVMQTTYLVHLRKGVAEQGNVDADHGHSAKNFIISYNEQGHKKVDLQLGANGGFQENTFDDQGRMEYYTTAYNKDHQTRALHIYDEHGNNTETISTSKDGSRYYRVTQTFNENHQVVEHIHVGVTDDIPVARHTHEYNSEGKVTRIAHYNNKNELETYTENKYNERGLMIESNRVMMDPDKKHYGQRHIQEYNEQGDCTFQAFYDGLGNLRSKYNYSHNYDKDGKRIDPPRPPSEHEGRLEHKVEEKDELGNWTKMIVTYDKLPQNIIYRQHTYWGNAEAAPLVHVLQLVPEAEKELIEVKHNHVGEMKEDIARWLVEEPVRQPDNFPYMRYYAQRFKEAPSTITFSGPHIEALRLLDDLKKDLGAIEVHTHQSVWSGWIKLNRYTLLFPAYWGHMLHATGLAAEEADEFQRNSHVRPQDDDKYYFSQLLLLHPSDASGQRDTYFEDALREKVDEFSMRKKPDKPRINIVEVSGANFVIQEYPVDDDFIIRDLDINYGHGFSKFHSDLMARFTKSTKGLVLFHGEPGTGKTYYIRHLLRSMVASNKVVIYMPPNMVDHLVEPAFMTFLIKQVKHYSDQGFFCVLLIEDAEPLLAKRVEGVRIQGITNLLNMTDGLLNDMLNLQIICTFNVDVRKLDSALLRPGRLIARKEFKALSELDANLLAQRLGIKHHFTKPATLGEIYAKLANSSTLVHDVNPGRDASERIDDLV